MNIIVFEKDQKSKKYGDLNKIGSEKDIIVFGSRRDCAKKGEIAVKKKFAACIIAVAVLLCVFGTAVSADTGPKQSVIVSFKNLSTNECWGTLLSADSSTGPAYAWDGTSGSEQFHDNEVIWRAFEEYEDSDGYYFLQEFWDCGESKSIEWTYYPPEKFKILLYFPETDEYAVSEKCERYAFHSYFTADVSEMKTVTVAPDGTLDMSDVTHSDGSSDGDSKGAVTCEHDFTSEIVGLLVRMLICVAIELLTAFAFGFREKKLVLLILIANICTQLVLNAVLLLMYFKNGGVTVVYGLLELLVLAAEIAVYTFGFKKIGCGDIKKSRTVIYTVAANAISFVCGLILARFIPAVF